MLLDLLVSCRSTTSFPQLPSLTTAAGCAMIPLKPLTSTGSKLIDRSSSGPMTLIVIVIMEMISTFHRHWLKEHQQRYLHEAQPGKLNAGQGGTLLPA